jgi:hypothetical protein
MAGAVGVNTLIKTLASFPNVTEIQILVNGEKNVAWNHFNFNGIFNLDGEFRMNNANDNTNVLSLSEEPKAELSYFENLQYPGNHALYIFEPVDGSRWTIMLSQPIRQGPSGIWCVERMNDENGNVYLATLDTDMTAADYYADQQNKADEGIGRGEGPYEGAFFLHAEATALRYLETREEYAGYRQEIASGEASASLFMYPTYVLMGSIAHRAVAESNTIQFRQVEWLTHTDEDAERLNQLGNPETPSGFYVHESYAGPQMYGVSENVTVNIIDWGNNGQTHKPISYNEFEALLGNDSEYPRIWRLSFENGLVNDIMEQYRP